MLSKTFFANKSISSILARKHGYSSTKIAAASAAPVQVTQTKLIIDGKLVDSVSGKKFQTIDPRTGKPIASIAEADALGICINA
jgi:aldehyde dehydrogenase (NAD+)